MSYWFTLCSYCMFRSQITICLVELSVDWPFLNFPSVAALLSLDLVFCAFSWLWHFNIAESREDKVVGQLLQGVVRSIDRSRKVIYLSSDPDAVSKCVVGLLLQLLHIFSSLVNFRLQLKLIMITLYFFDRPRMLRVFQLIFLSQAWWLMLVFYRLLRMGLSSHS